LWKGARGHAHVHTPRFTRQNERGINSSPSEKDEYVRGVKRATRELVKQQWPAIEKVAAALPERGSLSGDEVVQLISSE
jgi:hypothetical protein